MKMCFRAAALLLCLATLLGVLPVSAGTDYLLDDGEKLALSQAYVYKETISLFGDHGELLVPEDLYIDANNYLYIADTGNNAVLVLNDKRETVRVLQFEDGDQRAMNAPGGVFCDTDGSLYIGDTGNKRILHLSAEGAYIEEFGVPESDVLGKDFLYSPRRIAVSDTGYLYTIKEKSLMKIDANNTFQGYIGATTLAFSLKNMFIRLFASKEQKSKLLNQEPPPYLSFALARDGELYATTTDSASGQIMKLDVTGANMFPAVFYGENSVDADGNTVAPYFADITADGQSVVTALEQHTGKLYQYDADGNLLAVFGYGIGKKKGQFSIPVAVDVDNAGNIYVLDSQMGAVIVYEPTAFIESVHAAVALYNAGKYREAKTAFEAVLAIDGNYDLAYEGIGRILVKEGDYTGAMEYYRMANDKAGYSTAFSKYRHEFFRAYFFWIVLAAVALLVGAYFAVIGLKKAAVALRGRYFRRQMRGRVFYFVPLLLCMLVEPQEVCFYVKRDRSRLKLPSLLLMWAVLVAAHVGGMMLTGYPLATTAAENVNPVTQGLLVMALLFTWAIAQYAVTAIFSGEATFGEILTLSTISTVPYMLLSVPIALLSRLMGQGEQGLYSMLTGMMMVWMVILLLRCLKYANGYFFGRMVLVTVITLLAMLLIWAIILLIYALGGQFVGFIRTVFTEVTYALERGA